MPRVDADPREQSARTSIPRSRVTWRLPRVDEGGMPHVPPQHGPVKNRTRFLLIVLALVALIGSSAGSPASAATTYQIPAAIVNDCSIDVTQSILSWIGSVPDGSTLSFDAGACYRIEGTLQLQGRSGLTLDGNGAVFRSFNAPADQRAIWRLVGSTGMVLRDMTIQGSYANGGTLNTSLQHAHAVDLRGTDAAIANVTMSDVAGDCVYFGLGYDNTTRSSGSVQGSTCLRTGRNAVSVTAGDNILVQHLTTDRIGFTVFDVEPNSAPGNWGSNNVTFDSNTIGSYYLYAYSIVEQAPISNQSFTNNTVGGRGLRIGAVQDVGFRPQNVTITGNSSTAATSSPAMQFVDVNGLTATGNTVPMTGGAMASVSGSCAVNISGNLYPGGSPEATISPYSGCSATAAPAPSISSFSPSSGSAGTTVTISGSGFTGATAVKFNGTTASFAVNSASQITATVPSGASSGTISVTTPGGTTASSSSFSVTTSKAPSITSFSPGSGGVGTTVTISGSGFTGATAVKFNGTTASFAVNSASQVTATVPSGASSGKISVTTSGGTAASSSSFSITSSTQAPSITSFSPGSGSAGTTVTISGSGFTGAIAVTFNGTTASFAVNSSSQVTATVPSGASSGTISVTTPGGTTTSSSSFLITSPTPTPSPSIAPPWISSFSPDNGQIGTAVTISGSGFTGATAVMFNGTPAPFTVSSDTQIVAIAPPGGSSGTISVTTPTGTDASTKRFRFPNH
jgi:hypothetical protein